MLKFIHLSDIHLISGGRRLFGVSPERRLNAAIDSINREHADSNFVVFTGDITHWSDAASYAIFADAIDRLKMPVRLLAGNHDSRQALSETVRDVAVDGNGFIQYAVDTPAGRCLFLDTKKEGSDAGEYCSKRLAWLEQQLESSTGPILLFMHHPPMKLGLTGMDKIALLDAEVFHTIVKPHVHRIHHLFFGHVHRAISGNWRGISFTCMRGLNQQLALDLNAPEDSFTGSFEQPAYGVVLADTQQVVVHLHAFMDRSPKFDLVTPKGKSAEEYSLEMRHGDWDMMT